MNAPILYEIRLVTDDPTVYENAKQAMRSGGKLPLFEGVTYLTAVIGPPEKPRVETLA